MAQVQESPGRIPAAFTGDHEVLTAWRKKSSDFEVKDPHIHNTIKELQNEREIVEEQLHLLGKPDVVRYRAHLAEFLKRNALVCMENIAGSQPDYKREQNIGAMNAFALMADYDAVIEGWYQDITKRIHELEKST